MTVSCSACDSICSLTADCVAFAGCEKTYNTAEALLAHHKSSRHRTGTLRASTAPFALAESQRPLSPLPDALPAYMSIPRRVSRHPISKERHQWLGPKVNLHLNCAPHFPLHRRRLES